MKKPVLILLLTIILGPAAILLSAQGYHSLFHIHTEETEASITEMKETSKRQREELMSINETNGFPVMFGVTFSEVAMEYMIYDRLREIDQCKFQKIAKYGTAAYPAAPIFAILLAFALKKPKEE